MAVAFDAKATAVTVLAGATPNTTISVTNMTVGSIANGALLAVVSWVNGQASTPPTSPSAHWDTAGANQAMTQIGTSISTGPSTNRLIVALFGLLAPVAGNKNFTLSWTNAANVYVDLISFSGVDQGSIATAFSNFNSATGTASPASVIITSAVGNYTAATFVADSAGDLTTLNQTAIYAPSILDPNGSAAANYAAGAATNTHSCTISATSAWAVCGASINAVSAVINLVLGDYTLDAGLAGLDAVCDKIFICGAMPTSYADATSGANSLGSYNFGAGNAFNTDSSYAGGMQISSVAITTGSVSTNGTVAAWAAVDSANSRLLASGKLTGGAAVTAGQNFSLGSLTIQMPKGLS